MQVEIDPHGPVPPSEQIADAFRFAVAAGRLAPGERLPSVRGLARDALVNPNTVGKAYRELEREGTVVTRPGSGVFVAPGARERCARMRERTLRRRLGGAVSDALAAGLTREQVLALVAACLDGELEQAS